MGLIVWPLKAKASEPEAIEKRLAHSGNQPYKWTAATDIKKGKRQKSQKVLSKMCLQLSLVDFCNGQVFWQGDKDLWFEADGALAERGLEGSVPFHNHGLK